MAANEDVIGIQAPIGNVGWPARDFTLKDAYGNSFRLFDLKGPYGTLVIFLSNRCPFVRAIADRIARDAFDLQKRGVGAVAVMSNDPEQNPEDGPDGMRRFAREHRFSFPYVIDETQAVARAYGAVCTPDFFGFNAAMKLRYRGRLDASRTAPVPNARRELFEALCQIAETGRGPEHPIPSVGCPIAWRGPRP